MIFFMSALFRNKYRIGSDRYMNYDYSRPGKYFITICTKNKIPYFGNVENGRMILSEFGVIADKYWREIPAHFPFIELDEFIVMPDHMHGIIIIKNMTNPVVVGLVEPLHATVLPPPPPPPPQTNPLDIPHVMEIPKKSNQSINEHMSSISPKSGSLGSIVRSYKSAVSKNAHKIDPGFEWQQSFYDHIIRSNSGLKRIRNYIMNNPSKWHNIL